VTAICASTGTTASALGVETHEIDVESADAEALAARGVPLAFLPVLWHGQRVVAHGHLSEKQLRKELAL
jgi:hypothetical protein